MRITTGDMSDTRPELIIPDKAAVSINSTSSLYIPKSYPSQFNAFHIIMVDLSETDSSTSNA
jgi:hypothetical protein